MNYVDQSIKDIIKENGNEEMLTIILCNMYASIQMDSSVRADFENKLRGE